MLLKQKTVSGSGISWAICKYAPRSRQITTPALHHSVFTGQMPFLPPNQQCQSTEGYYQLILLPNVNILSVTVSRVVVSSMHYNPLSTFPAAPQIRFLITTVRPQLYLLTFTCSTLHTEIKIYFTRGKIPRFFAIMRYNICNATGWFNVHSKAGGAGLNYCRKAKNTQKVETSSKLNHKTCHAPN